MKKAFFYKRENIEYPCNACLESPFIILTEQNIAYISIFVKEKKITFLLMYCYVYTTNLK